MQLPLILGLLLSAACGVEADTHRHHHADLKLDAYHHRIQKRNNTPFETPMPAESSTASFSTGRPTSSPYTDINGPRPHYETSSESPSTPSTDPAHATSTITATTTETDTPLEAPTGSTGPSPQVSIGASKGGGGVSQSPTDAPTLIGAPPSPSAAASQTTSREGLSMGVDEPAFVTASPKPVDASSLAPVPSVSGGLSEGSGVSSVKSGSLPTLIPAFTTEVPDTTTTTTASSTQGPGLSPPQKSSFATSDLSGTPTALSSAQTSSVPPTTLHSNETIPTTAAADATVAVVAGAGVTSTTTQDDTDSQTVSSSSVGESSAPTDPASMVLPAQVITAEPSTSAASGDEPLSASSAGAAAAATTSASAATVTNALPAAIAPATGIIMPNSSQTMVQFGFYEALNYPFVVSNALATAQILSYAPKCAAYALNIQPSMILDNSLRPYSMDGYTATVAYLVIPTDQLTKLEALWGNATSRLYNQADSSLESLAVLIDRSIPLLLTTGKDTAGQTTRGSSSATSSTGSNADPADYGSLANTATTSSSTSGSIKKIAGIGFGSAAAAGAYASLMFYAARRYRSRRITLFAPSTAGTFSSRPGSGFDRGYAISRPMNPENSLGI